MVFDPVLGCSVPDLFLVLFPVWWATRTRSAGNAKPASPRRLTRPAARTTPTTWRTGASAAIRRRLRVQRVAQRGVGSGRASRDGTTARGQPRSPHDADH